MARRFMQTISNMTCRIDVGSPYRDSVRGRSLLPVAIVPIGHSEGSRVFELSVSDVSAGSLRRHVPSAREDDLRRLAMEIRRSY